MSTAFLAVKAAALEFIDALEAYDQEGEGDSQEIIELMEDVSVWVRNLEKTIK
jgi:hypothetical protein